jgi:hypothetical protein
MPSQLNYFVCSFVRSNAIVAIVDAIVAIVVILDAIVAIHAIDAIDAIVGRMDGPLARSHFQRFG